VRGQFQPAAAVEALPSGRHRQLRFKRQTVPRSAVG
jgi:hypothetical protein